MYCTALIELVLTAFGAALLTVTLLHELAVRINMSINPGEALFLVWQIIIFLALWPGQGFWTITRHTASGRQHSVIGIPTADDIYAMNRHIAIMRSSGKLR